MPILPVIALLAFFASTVNAEQSDTSEIDPDDIIDNVVVVGVGRCGSWPIEHQGFLGCEFAELKKKELPSLVDLRQKLFLDCLICRGNQCTVRMWPEDRTREELICKRTFWTPTRISKLTNPVSRFASIVEYERNAAATRDSPLKVSYTFKISTEGRVEDIVLVSFDSEIEEAELLRLIADGAAETRFEPVIVADVSYELIGLRDTIVIIDQ